MAKVNARKRLHVFISHSSVNLDVAEQVEAVLKDAGFDPWLDRSDIRIGALLGRQLQQGIKDSRAVVLIWSKAAAASRWVATEVLSAFHLNRFILPCSLSATQLPQFLSRSVYLDLRRGRQDKLKMLVDQVKRAPRARNEFLTVNTYWTKQLEQAIYQLRAMQEEELDLVDQGDLQGASKLHAKLNPEIRAAVTRWRYDPTILNLAGYHCKNSYMLKHWEEYSAGRFPPDAVLSQGEQRFIENLLINPIDYSALNGLGNILFFEAQLHAAAFFMSKAVECATKAGVDYKEAKRDLREVRSLLPKT